MRGIRSIQDYIICIFDKTLILGSSYYKNKCNIVVQYILLFVSVFSNANLYFLPRINVKKNTCKSPQLLNTLQSSVLLLLPTNISLL
jgi:hypothetical protein